MHCSHGQVLVENFVPSQAGQTSGVMPLPLKPHLAQVNSSWILSHAARDVVGVYVENQVGAQPAFLVHVEIWVFIVSAGMVNV